MYHVVRIKVKESLDLTVITIYLLCQRNAAANNNSESTLKLKGQNYANVTRSMSTRRREDRARMFHRTRSRSICGERREGIYFSLARINLRVQVNQFPGPRRDLLETGRVVTLFITFFQVNFLSPIDDESQGSPR